MFSHESGRFQPMLRFNQVFLRRMLGEAERREQHRSGVTKVAARHVLARRMGVGPGTLDNFFRGRIKDLRGSVRDRIVDFLIAEIQTEKYRLEHDLQMALLCADRVDEHAVVAARAAIAQATELIERAPRRVSERELS